MISINKKGLFTILAVLVSLDASAASFFDKPAPKPATPTAEILPTKEATMKVAAKPVPEQNEKKDWVDPREEMQQMFQKQMRR